MGLFVGKISKKGYVRRLSNELPDFIQKINGKYYNKETGKFLKMKKISFKEYFKLDKEDKV